jgi:hypothetical protein
MSYDDACFVDTQTRQAIGEGNYQLFSPYSCECLIPETVKNATDNIAVPFKNGYGTEQACVVDHGSVLRVGKVRAFPHCPQREGLMERPYKTVPYMGRGFLRPNEESELIFAEDTRVKRSSNTLSGITVPMVWTPLVDHLSANVQAPVHLIQEYNAPAWRRGGNDTRLVVRDADYAARCGKAYQHPYTNDWFWQNKSQLLQQ